MLDDTWAQLQASVQNADVGTGTLESLGALLEVLALHYGSPDHLVAIQIGLDLANNPNTSATTRRAVIRHADRLARAWQPLSVDTLGPLADDPELVSYTFAALRGYLIGNTMAKSSATSSATHSSARCSWRASPHHSAPKRNAATSPTPPEPSCGTRAGRSGSHDARRV